MCSSGGKTVVVAMTGSSSGSGSGSDSASNVSGVAE